MHEASIAQSILDISIKNAKQSNANRITLIAVRIGKMAGVDEASLRYAIDAVKDGTIAKDATIEYTLVPLKGRCLDCGAESEFDGYFMKCDRCGSGRISMTAGDEFEVSYIEVE